MIHGWVNLCGLPGLGGEGTGARPSPARRAKSISSSTACHALAPAGRGRPAQAPSPRPHGEGSRVAGAPRRPRRGRGPGRSSKAAWHPMSRALLTSTASLRCEGARRGRAAASALPRQWWCSPLRKSRSACKLRPRPMSARRAPRERGPRPAARARRRRRARLRAEAAAHWPPRPLGLRQQPGPPAATCSPAAPCTMARDGDGQTETS